MVGRVVSTIGSMKQEDMAQENIVDVSADVSSESTVAATEALVTEELLVEEISIDGMCGVY